MLVKKPKATTATITYVQPRRMSNTKWSAEYTSVHAMANAYATSAARHRPAIGQRKTSSRNGHAACNDGSAPTGNAYLLFSPNTFATPVSPSSSHIARTMRTVWGMSPRSLASHGGSARGTPWVTDPHTE